MSVLIELVVWAYEIIFIKEDGTRMTRIRRIRTDLGVSDSNLYFLSFVNITILIEHENQIKRIRVHLCDPRHPCS